jgi:hypothetical protein
MSVRTYSPGEIVMTVNGVAMGGFADGTFITVARDEQSFTKVTGADGTVSRSKSNNRSGTVTLSLKQTSPSNEILSALLVQDELDNSGVVPVLIKDNSGTSRFFSGTGWVQGMPSVEYGKEIANREWVIEMADMEINVAGNIGVGVAEEA